MATERVTVRMMRGDPSTHWGFRMQGGQEYGTPLIIDKITQGGLAERAGLLIGDQILQIGGIQAQGLHSRDAEDIIGRSGNNLDIVVERAATRIWRPEVTPVDVPPGDMTTSPVKYSLVHDHAPQNYSTVGSAHNVQPRQFGQPQQHYSSTTTTKITNESYGSPSPAPSSRKTTVDEYLQKTGGLFGTDPKLTQKPPEPSYLKSETLRLIKESESRSSSMGPAEKVSPASQKDEGTQPQPTPGAGAPMCDHCGRYIYGIFCKIGNKTLHADCFKCSTCGSLLKNIGYYLINDKLYCDVHARQQQENYRPQPTTQYQTNRYTNDQNSNYSSSYKYHKTTKTTTTSTTNQQQQPYSIVVKPSNGDQPQYTAPPPPAPPMAPTTPINVTVAQPTPPPPPPPQSSQLFSAGPPTSQWPTSGSAPTSDMRSTRYRREVINETKWTSNAGAGETAPPFGKEAARKGRGILKQSNDTPRIPLCESCNRDIRGPFVLALGKAWCPDHFVCASSQCRRKLLDIGFIEENGSIYCEFCYEKHFAPNCSKCLRPIVGDCLTALERQWHPECFTCSHCRKPFGSTSFFVEKGQPYCEADWNQLFTTKCIACQFAIEAGDRWVDALGNAYHSDCFNCSVCQKNLEGQSFYAKAGRPYCKDHA